jgi:hypothetical protein
MERLTTFAHWAIPEHIDRQLIEHLTDDLRGDPDDTHTRKAKYLLDQIEKTKERRRTR